MEIHVDIKV